MTVALREVRLYGRLGREFGRVHRLAVATASEAARALCAVLPGFQAAFLGSDGQAAYHVYVGRGDRRECLAPARVDDLVGQTVIRFVPAIAGAKRAGIGQILLGAALIGLTLWNPLGAFSGQWAPFAFVGTVGKALILGGVIQMLSPQRKAAEAVQNVPSYGMDAGALNAPDAGSPVPLAYGRIVAGSVQISAGLSLDNSAPSCGGSLPAQPLPDYMDEQVVDPGASFVKPWDRGG